MSDERFVPFCLRGDDGEIHASHADFPFAPACGAFVDWRKAADGLLFGMEPTCPSCITITIRSEALVRLGGSPLVACPTRPAR